MVTLGLEWFIAHIKMLSHSCGRNFILIYFLLNTTSLNTAILFLICNLSNFFSKMVKFTNHDVVAYMLHKLNYVHLLLLNTLPVQTSLKYFCSRSNYFKGHCH